MMTDIEKIRTMHDITVFEREHGKEIEEARMYFQSDYISRHVLLSFVGYSFFFAAFLAMLLICSSDTILQMTGLDELIELGKQYILYYLFGLVIYEIITVVIYTVRYEKSRRLLRQFNARLRKLGRKQDR